MGVPAVKSAKSHGAAAAIGSTSGDLRGILLLAAHAEYAEHSKSVYSKKRSADSVHMQVWLGQSHCEDCGSGECQRRP